MKRKKIDFRLPLALIEQLKLISDYKGLSMTAYVTLALTEKLKGDLKEFMEIGGKWKRN